VLTTSTESLNVETKSEPPIDHEMVEAMAYQLWLRRGCPSGSDQEDWYSAEAELTEANLADNSRA